MKPTKNTEQQVIEVYDKWLYGYLNGDVKTYDAYFDDAFHFIGSTNNEEFLNRKDTTDFFRSTAEQLSGKTQIRNETKIVEQFGELVFITHLFDAWFRNGKDWSYYGRFRFSNILQQHKSGWHFVYQHYSTPDSKAQDGETIGYNQINKENLELREAIQRRTVELEAKNRELEIEGALERIRAQAVAMKESSGLLDIVVNMRKEFIKLGCEAHYFWHMMWLPSSYEKAMTSGDGTRIGFIMELPRHIHGDIPLLCAWEKSTDATVVYAMDTATAIDYVDKMITLGNFKQIDPQAPTHDDIRRIGGLTFIMARTTHGEIGYSLPGAVENPPKEAIDLLVRFAGAFDLAHRRFLDLQKAEKQSREVQIELALEKVRSRTMAMKHSDELQQTSFLLDQQVRALGIDTWGCAFNIYRENDAIEWFGNEQGILPTYIVPREGVFKAYYNAGQAGEKMLIKEFKGKACIAHYEYMSGLPIIGDVLKQLKKNNGSFPDYQIDHVVYHKYGYLLFITKEPVPEAHSLFKKFAKVFEQTYTRFLDLQKAEEQAREGKIEAALERVRSRSMAMRTSEELLDVITVVSEQLQQLDFKFAHASFANNDQGEDYKFWVAAKGLRPRRFVVPYLDMATMTNLRKAQNRNQNFFTDILSLEEQRKWHKHLLMHGGNEVFSSEMNDYIMGRGMARSIAINPNIMLILANYASIPYTNEENKIIERFGHVFEQSYTRFLDLKKAEAQAREAQIEAALEKVRSRTMAMQHSNELPEAANDLFLQVQELGIPAWSAGYCIWTENKKEATAFMSSEGVIQKPFVLPNVGVGYDFDKPMQNGETFHIGEIGGELIKEHYGFMRTLPVFGEVIDDILKAGHPLPSFQIFHICYFKYGYVMFITYERVPKSHDIFMRFATVFEQTYTRFLDLQVKEEQATALLTEKKRLEDTLYNLQTTQKQLIQAEKMASLGELTAGIAHEIQNPLNFVNNFSEVSNELIDEMNEELGKGDFEEAKFIANDIKQNLEKINHHGKRADAIVKGMLQHSRKNSGHREPTDINALTDEYLRLAYHGLRAKDKSFNATMNTDFDDGIGKINVVPQDLGRVILNLITNAFYAVNEKRLKHPKDYRPTVSVCTKRRDDIVEIKVTDNGNGIPSEVIDKIFQPFFTTKPTGQGTGLGLSMSYDIITKGHGGKLMVETNENKGTTFIIELP